MRRRRVAPRTCVTEPHAGRTTMTLRCKPQPTRARRRSRIVRTAALALTGLMAFAGPAGAAAGGCHHVNGTFVASTPATCSSFFCTEGHLSGDLEGLYSFV